MRHRNGKAFARIGADLSQARRIGLRPGAAQVDADEEISSASPSAEGSPICGALLSIDTRAA